MDEFLVSGENMIRNLQLGWRRAEELGTPMPLGYLPDMFGHVAQMPQILRRAGIDAAMVWRGVPPTVDRHLFRWEAPDGSAVTAHYLNEGYGSGAYLLSVPDKGVASKLAPFAAAMRPYFGDDALLAMYGTDHMLPDLTLLAHLDGVNAGQPRLPPPDRYPARLPRGDGRRGGRPDADRRRGDALERTGQHPHGQRIRPHRPQGGLWPRRAGGWNATRSRSPPCGARRVPTAGRPRTCAWHGDA